jgi:hypothetical protein
VALAASAPELRLVRGVLEEGVFEGVADARRLATLMEDLGVDEPGEALAQGVGVEVAHGLDE